MHTNTTGGPTDRPTNISSPRHHPDAVASNALANIVTDRLGFVAFTGRYGIAGDFLRWLDEHRPGWQTEPAPTVKPSRDALALVVRELVREKGNVVYKWPDDEAAAYRDNYGFSEGLAAVEDVRTAKGVDAILALLPGVPEREARAAAWQQGYSAGHSCVGAANDCTRIPNPYRDEVERGEGRG